MPINFNNPTILQSRTDYGASLRDAQAALAQWLDPAVAGTLTGTPTGAYRLNSGAVERFNGTSWAAQAINGVNFDGTNASIGGASVGGRLGLIGTDQLLRLANDAAYVAFHNSANTTRSGYLQLHASGTSRLMVEAAQALVLGTSATDRVVVEAGGHLRPAANNAYTLGTTGERWATVNTVALNASGAATTGALTVVGNASASGSITANTQIYASQQHKVIASRGAGTQTSGQIVVFPTEEIDTGGIYNNSNGHFTPSIGGNYLLTVCVSIYNNTGSPINPAVGFHTADGVTPLVPSQGVEVEAYSQRQCKFTAVVNLAASTAYAVYGSTAFSSTMYVTGAATYFNAYMLP